MVELKTEDEKHFYISIDNPRWQLDQRKENFKKETQENYS